MRDNRKIYIDGSWIAPSGSAMLDVVNPATEEVAGRISVSTAEDVDRAVAAARRAFRSFSQTTREQRLDLLNAILAGFLARRQNLADVLVEELGAPAQFAFDVQAGIGIMHITTGIEALKSYAFEQSLGPRTIVRREPIGVVGMITPWNWPINQVMCKVVPALATGNTIVHKPSEVTPFSAHIIAEILHDAGVPAGVYNLVDGDGPTVGTAISAHPGIDMVSFTGSTRAGIDVARRAAETVKRVHQELGGKSPAIVLEDADLPKAIGHTIHRMMVNSGQTCHAPTRLLVPRARLGEAKAIASNVTEGISVGDPRSNPHMGPVVSQRQWDRIQQLIRTGREEGATLIAGGEGRPKGLAHGFYVRPTIFADVTNDMTIGREEIFGPVLCMIAYDDADDAVAIANDTSYGLAAYLWAATDEEASAVAARLEAGMVFINGAGEDAEAPFGGYKMSGNGREWGPLAFDEFVETKAVMRTA